MAESLLRILVTSEYVPAQSEPAQNAYVFHYHIEICNLSAQQLTLQRRYWLITDGNGKQTEVEGAGVVGETPTLAPGQQFSYSSAVVLETPFGTMQGHYQLDGESGAVKAPITPFQLCQPGILH